MTFDFNPRLSYETLVNDHSGMSVTHFDPGDPAAWHVSPAERLVQIGMRAVVRDLQDYVYAHDMTGTLNASELRAYLLAQLIIAGGFDGQG